MWTKIPFYESGRLQSEPGWIFLSDKKLSCNFLLDRKYCWKICFFFFRLLFRVSQRLLFSCILITWHPGLSKRMSTALWSGQLSCVICFVCIIGAHVSGFYCGRSLQIVCVERPKGACLSSSVQLSSWRHLWSQRPTNVISQRNRISNDRPDR